MKQKIEFAANSGSRDTAPGHPAHIQFHAVSANECKSSETSGAVTSPPPEIEPWVRAFTDEFATNIWRQYPRDPDHAWKKIADKLGVSEVAEEYSHLGPAWATVTAFLELPILARHNLSRRFPLEVQNMAIAFANHAPGADRDKLMNNMVAPEVLRAAAWQAEHSPKMFFKITNQPNLIH